MEWRGGTPRLHGRGRLGTQYGTALCVSTCERTRWHAFHAGMVALHACGRSGRGSWSTTVYGWRGIPHERQHGHGSLMRTCWSARQGEGRRRRLQAARWFPSTLTFGQLSDDECIYACRPRQSSGASGALTHSMWARWLQPLSTGMMRQRVQWHRHCVPTGALLCCLLAVHGFWHSHVPTFILIWINHTSSQIRASLSKDSWGGKLAS